VSLRSKKEDIKIKTLERLMRIYSKIAFNKGLKVSILRRADISLERVKSDKEVTVKFNTLTGTPFIDIKPKKIIKNKVLLYLHGGAYVSGPIKIQIDFIKDIAIRTKSRAYVVDYRMTPEYTYKETFEDVLKVYFYLIEKYGNEQLMIIGDSAGGGLALAISMYLRDINKPLPNKNILLSPWLDVSLTNKSITKLLDTNDYVLSKKGLIEAGKAYSRNTDIMNYMVSPLYGSLYKLPKTLLLTGTNEILLFDCRELKKHALIAKLDLTYKEYEKMFHAFVVAPPILKEIGRGREDIVKFINDVK